jgi:hypothetical protein
MSFRVLKLGSKGSDVRRWQTFLRGLNLYKSEVDGIFGPATADATRALQRRANKEGHTLIVDGIAGNQTIGYAMMLGFEVVETPATDDDENGPNWPPPPEDLSPLTNAKREKLFGHIEWMAAPTTTNPEAIRITNGWAKENIVSVAVPQLVGVARAPKSGKVQVHRLAADPIVQLFQAWDDAGFIGDILAWAGSWAPRLIRGSTSNLSNHAFGTAFDVNAPWNVLGARPALVPEKGSVRKLVPIANEHGWYWGGHYKTRKDGMHFELARVDA